MAKYVSITFSFSGSGGAGEAHMQTRTIAGKAHQLESGEAAVRCPVLGTFTIT